MLVHVAPIADRALEWLLLIYVNIIYTKNGQAGLTSESRMANKTFVVFYTRIPDRIPQ